MPTPRAARPSGAPTPPWGILQGKKDAKLASGHFVKGAMVDPANRSRFGGHPEGDTPLGLGYVEAVLAVLYGIVGVITYDPPGLNGRVTMRSTGGPTAYHFAWRTETGRLLIGGFGHSDGLATYQSAVVALVQLVVQHRVSPSSQTDELVTRWYALVDAMEAAHPRVNHDAGWSRAAIGAACADITIRAHIERVCDSLYYAMRYHLPSLPDDASVPTLVERGVLVQSPDPLSASEGTSVTLPGTILINPELAAGDGISVAPTAPAPTPALAPDAAGGEHTAASRGGAARSGGAVEAPSGATTAMASPAVNPPDTPSAPTPTPGPKPRTPFRGGNAARVERALRAARGPLFLVGPTSTGKTSLAIRAAELLAMGIELFACDPGMDAQEPFGGYARRTRAPREAVDATVPPVVTDAGETTSESVSPSRLPAWAQALYDRITRIASDTEQLLHTAQARVAELESRVGDGQGDWEAIDGPITRWARRAQAGERVLLIIDELARAHESCVSAVMRVLNTYDRATIIKQGLRIPDDFATEEQFHIVDVWMTKERLLVPASRVKIIATANIGDRYLGLDLSDPAFRRRWTGGWLHLGGYDAPTTGQILADRLELPVGAPLIAKLTAVATLVEQEQRSEDKLLSTLDLATLITWGQLVIHLHAGGLTLKAAWETAASDVWVERICPLKGAELDLDVKTRLIGFVSGNVPTAIR